MCRERRERKRAKTERGRERERETEGERGRGEEKGEHRSYKAQPSLRDTGNRNVRTGCQGRYHVRRYYVVTAIEGVEEGVVGRSREYNYFFIVTRASHARV